MFNQIMKNRIIFFLIFLFLLSIIHPKHSLSESLSVGVVEPMFDLEREKEIKLVSTPVQLLYSFQNLLFPKKSQKSSNQESPSQESPSQESPSQESPSQKLPNQESSSQESSNQESSSQGSSKKKKIDARVVYTGIQINQVSNINLEKQTSLLDFYLWFRFRGELETQNIEFLNGLEGVSMERIQTYKKEGTNYHLYHAKGTFLINSISLSSKYQEQVIGISFSHKKFSLDQLVYVTNFSRDRLANETAFFQQVKRGQVLAFLPAWEFSKKIDIFHDFIEKDSLGHPQYAKGLVKYSRFNFGFTIHKAGSLTLLKWIPSQYARYIFVFGAIFMFLLLRFIPSQMEKSGLKKNGFYEWGLRLINKMGWMLQIILGILMLWSAQVFVVEEILGKDNEYLPSFLIAFEVLWWIIPAIFVNSGIHNFFWIPLERAMGRPAPHIIRHFLSFLVYLMAFFGVIAFVYEETLTSLLATSGVFAMIIGLAIQMNITNIFSGIVINIEAPFHVGDWVKIQDRSGDIEGKVIDITWRSTRIEIAGNSIVSIPNGKASESVIHNYHYPDSTCSFVIPLSLDSVHPPERVKKILLDALLSSENVVKYPRPSAKFTGVDEEIAHYTLTFFVKDYGNKDSVIESVWKRVWSTLSLAGMMRIAQKQKRLNEEIRRIATEEIELFHYFTSEEKEMLSQQMHDCQFEAGKMVVEEGEKSTSLYLIAEGTLGGYVTLENGKRVEVSILGGGDFFGEISLLTGAPRAATVMALSDSHLFEIRKEDLAPILRKNPELFNLLSTMVTKRKISMDSAKMHHENPAIEEENLRRDFLQKIQNFFSSYKEEDEFIDITPE